MNAFAQVIRLTLCLALLTAPTPLMAAEQSVSDQPSPTLLAQVPAQPAMPQLPAPSSSAPASVPGGMQGTVSLDLRNIDVVDALKFLAMKGGINIITSKAVSGRVTLMVTAAPIQDVFDLMLRSNNLAYDRQGDIYSVMTQEEYRALYGKSFSDVRQVKAFSLNYTVPKRAYDMLDALKSEIGRVIVDEETGNVLLLDSPQQLEMLSEALKNFEDKNAVKVIKLNYAKAKDIEEVLKKQVDVMGLAGNIKADERGNNIIVQTLPERMQQFEELVRSLDQKTKEIIIDTNIVQVVLRDEVSTGIEWEGLFDAARTAGGTKRRPVLWL